MKSRKYFVLSSLLLAMLGLFLLAHTLPAHSQGNPAADLGLHKAVTPLTALEPGDEIQYTLTFSNAGVLTATDVLISDTLPTLLTGVAVTSNLPITATGQGSWIVAPLPPEADGIITVTATVSPLLTSELPFTNTATITSPITDTEPANNTSFVVSEVNLPPVVDAGPDASAIVGQPFALTATFTDPGLDDTHTAVIVWGEGLTGTAILSETAHTLSAAHVYTATGAFTATVGVRDNDGGQGEDSVMVKVGEDVGAQFMQYLPILVNFLGNPLNIPLVSPAPNSVNEFQQGPISAQYGIRLLDTLVYTKSFVVHSMQTGIITGTFEHYIDFISSTLKVTSAQPLQAGDTLQAILTTDLVGVMGIDVLHPDFPRVWQFQTATTYGSGYMVPASPLAFDGSKSTDLAGGDVDRDGDEDVIITHQDRPTMVWLNDGQGNFAPHPITPNLGAGAAQAIALGDLDNDGDVDAVLATFEEESVWLNDRQGNFSPHPTMPTFGAGASLDTALGDLNGDSFLDALVANTNGEPETVWLNDGTGAFSPHPTLPSFGAGESTGVALGDVDGDFDLDAVIANSDGEPETVWLNDSFGLFTPHETMPTFGAGASQAVRLGDLDGDGDLDAVVANDLGEAETVWMNDGTGAFVSHSITPSFGAGDSTDLALGDLDGDGDLDVVVANTTGAPETVWLNDGAGLFTSHSVHPNFGEGNSQGILVGDLNGDHALDVVVVNNLEPDTIWLNTDMRVMATSPSGNGSVIAQNGTLLITFNASLEVNTVTPQSFIVRGEFTGEYSGVFNFPTPNQVQFTPAMPFLPGEQITVNLTDEILSVIEYPLRPFTWSMRAEVTGGTGVFAMHSGSPFNFGAGQIKAIGDLDGDRDLDTLILLDSGLSIWLNDGSGNFSPHPTIPALSIEGTNAVSLGNLDQDGDLDLVVAGASQFTIWLNDGTGAFSPHPTFPNFGQGSNNNVIPLADLDGDGDLDAIVTNADGFAGIWLNNGIGEFSPNPSNFSFGDETFHHLLFGDLDDDGDLDAISGGNEIKLWRNNGSGDFTLQLTILNQYASDISLGDLDEDGDLDIFMIFDYLYFSSPIWINEGNWQFTFCGPHLNYMAPSMALGDLDGDGDLDLVTAAPTQFSSDTRVWMNDGSGYFPPSPTYLIPNSYHSIGVGDLDGDGDLDLLFTCEYSWCHQAVWLNQSE